MIVGAQARKAFEDNLPQMYHEAEYNVIFPNGTRVPATQVQEHMAANPELRPLKMMGDLEVAARLVLVCEMVVLDPAEWKRVYFRQAFYLSTGTSSGMPNTWVPFDGLVYGSPSDPFMAISYMQKHRVQYGLALMKKPSPGKTYDVHNQIWIDKAEFARDPAKGYNRFYDEPEFNRLGPLSHIIMSYCLGGGLWEFDVAREAVEDFLRRQGAPGAMSNPVLPSLLESLKPARPVVPLFEEMIRSPDIPIAPVAVINDYILGNRATSYMNAFLGLEGGDIDFIRIPGLFVDVMQGEKRFRLILYAVLLNLRRVLRDILGKIRDGAIPPTKADVEAAILRRVPEIVKVGDDPGWNLLDHIGQLRFHLRPDREVTGGRRKTRRRKIYRKARKSKKNMGKLQWR